jgi:hypothetical protein
MAYINGKEILFYPKAIGTTNTKLITKIATANGTYKASADGADGYSEFTVNVAGDATPYFDGEIIIEKAQEGVLGLRKLNDVLSIITVEESSNVVTNEELFNNYGFSIEPITIEGTQVIGLSCYFYYAPTEAKFFLVKTDTDYFEFPIENIYGAGLNQFTVTSTNSTTVDEWLLANTEGVSV